MNNVFMMIFVVAVITFIIRALPFLVFQNTRNDYIEYLGNVLPFAIMAMLVVYCLKDVQILGDTHGLPEIIGVLSVIVLQVNMKNTLVSIFGGTIIYMLCVQIIF